MAERAGDRRRRRVAPAPKLERPRASAETRVIGELRGKLNVANGLLRRREHLVNELSIHREELQAQNDALTRSEHDLWATRERLSNLFEQAPIPYLTLNGAAVIAACNQEATRFLGRRSDQLVGTPFSLFVGVPDRPRFRQHIAACRRARETSQVHLTLSLPGGTVPVHLSSILTNDDWIYTAVIDLRERMQAEQERRELTVRAEAARAASEAKDQFLAALSHELRTPLTPVVAAVSALERLCATARADAGDLFAVIRRNLGFELRLIDDLLDVTRLTHGKLTLDLHRLDMHVVVREALDQLRVIADKKGVRVGTALAAAQPLVRGDADRLRQVLTNLLRNAINFTPAGGNVVVASRNYRGHLCVTVRDTGAGLAKEDHERIFDRFVQGANARPREGLGLGLPIAHGIVLAHAGRLTVSSDGPGRGSTFEVRLRCAPRAGRAEGARDPRDRVATRGAPAARSTHARILFVEDHADTARMMTHFLEQAGHRVTVADSVASALAHADEPLDLILSDIGLPDGSGLDLMRELVARRGPLPGIALSGYGTREDINRSRSAGFSRHLVKPIDVPVLLRVIDELHARSGRAPVLR